MNWLTRLYPRAWRERYGEEFTAFLEDADPGPSAVANIIGEALRMRFEQIDRRMLAAFALAGLAIGSIAAYRMPDRFISTAVLRLTASSAADAESIAAEAVQLKRGAMSRTNLSGLMQSPELDLYRDERMREPLEDVIEQMKKDDLRCEILPAKPGQPGTAIRLSYEGPDPARARILVNRLVERFVEDHRMRQLVTGSSLAQGNITEGEALRSGLGSRIELLDPPSLDPNPVRPNRKVILAVGLVGGIAAFFAFLVFRRFWKAILSGAAGALAAWILVFNYLPQPHESSALLQADSSDTVTALLADREILAIVRDRAVRQAASPDLKPGDIRIEATREPRGIRIGVRNNDRLVAQRGNQSTISALVNHFASQRVVQGLPDNGFRHAPWVEVVDPPSLPVRPSPPRYLLTLPEWLILAGAVLGAGLARIGRHRHAAPSPAAPSPAVP